MFYLIVVGQDELGLSSLDSDKPDITPDIAKKAAERAIAKFVDLTFPDITQSNKIRYAS